VALDGGAIAEFAVGGVASAGGGGEAEIEGTHGRNFRSLVVGVQERAIFRTSETRSAEGGEAGVPGRDGEEKDARIETSEDREARVKGGDGDERVYPLVVLDNRGRGLDRQLETLTLSQTSTGTRSRSDVKMTRNPVRVNKVLFLRG